MDRATLLDRIKNIEEDTMGADDERIRDFLRRKVGRWLIAVLLGKPDKPNIVKADSYLYKKAILDKDAIRKIGECYLAALIINELRFIKDGIDRKIAKTWLKMPCPYLEGHAPIYAIRDGRTYNHLSAIGAAKTFLLDDVTGES